MKSGAPASRQFWWSRPSNWNRVVENESFESLIHSNRLESSWRRFFNSFRHRLSFRLILANFKVLCPRNQFEMMFLFTLVIYVYSLVEIIHAVYQRHIFKNMIWSQFENRICVFLIYLKDFWDMAHMGFQIDAFSLSLLELNWTYRHCICKNC